MAQREAEEKVHGVRQEAPVHQVRADDGWSRPGYGVVGDRRKLCAEPGGDAQRNITDQEETRPPPSISARHVPFVAESEIGPGKCSTEMLFRFTIEAEAVIKSASALVTDFYLYSARLKRFSRIMFYFLFIECQIMSFIFILFSNK